jgi:CheY-like chemotaxis protein
MAGKKLLVADDSLTIQKVIRLALSNEGYEIQAVSDGNDAVQQISVFRPDVVLIDVSLPGKTAFEVKREVNQHEDLAEVCFVLMSSAFEKVDEAQAAEVRFHGRLTKPFDPAHLRQVLADVLTQGQAKHTEVTSRINRPAAATPPPTPAQVAPAPPSLPTSRFGVPTRPSPQAPQIKPPPVPTVDEFESAPEILDLSAHLTPPPSPGAPMPQTLEPERFEHDDIKHLTESTIKMSGLADDFQWSVSEPTLKPPSKLKDDGNTTFELDLRDEGEKAPPSVPSFTPPVQAKPPKAPTSNGGAMGATHAGAALSGALSKEEMAEVLRSELRRILPEIAEKVIKDEIHRMLSEKT